MRKISFVMIVLSIFLFIGAQGVMALEKPLNVKGYLWMWYNDDDGDGIPNGQDPDWFPPEDGTGYQHKHSYNVETFMMVSSPNDNGNSSAYKYHYGPEYNPKDNGDQIKIKLRWKLKDGSCLE